MITTALSPEENFRSPPQNLEAEQALLGAILSNNEAYARAFH
jgi:replicative DNA helicase